MAIKIICDKCRKEFVPSNQEPYFEGLLVKKSFRFQNVNNNVIVKQLDKPAIIEIMTPIRIHFCPVCAIKFTKIFEDFLANKEK